MDAKEELLGIAQIAVTMIGFSGLLFVFRSRNLDRMAPRDLSALAMIISSGGFALAFALVPLPFAYLGIGEERVWRLCCGTFCVGLLIGTVVFASIDRRLTSAGHRPRTPRFNRTVLTLLPIMAALLAGSAFGFWPFVVATYLLSLVVCLLVSLALVVVMLLVARAAGD